MKASRISHGKLVNLTFRHGVRTYAGYIRPGSVITRLVKTPKVIVATISAVPGKQKHKTPTTMVLSFSREFFEALPLV